MFNQLVYTLQQVRQLGKFCEKNAVLINAIPAIKDLTRGANSALKRLFQAKNTRLSKIWRTLQQVDIALEYRGK